MRGVYVTTSALTSVTLLATGLQPGDSVRTECPFCCASEKAFNVTRLESGLIAYQCWRNSCARKGYVRDGNAVEWRSAPSTPRKQRLPWNGRLVSLTDAQHDLLACRVGFDSDHIAQEGIMYAPESNRYAYPIRDPHGKRRGWLLRKYSDFVDGERKVLTHLDSDDALPLSWYPHWQQSRIVVVEDIPSAIRLHRHTGAVALLGTGFGTAALDEFMAHAPRSVVWALDADAVTTSAALHKKYGNCFRSSVILAIDEDFKDMPEWKLKLTLAAL